MNHKEGGEFKAVSESHEQQLEKLVAERTHALEMKTLALAEAEERLRFAMEATRDGIWDWNIETGETYCSQSYFDILGYEPSQLAPHVDSLFIDLLHPESRDEILTKIHEQLSGAGFYSIEFQMRAKDGSYRWINSRGKVVARAPDGRPIRAIGTHHDITVRKHAELSLIESETRFREMADTAPVMIWMSGVDKLCYFFNRTWLAFTGRTQEQESGNGWADGVHPDDFDRCLKIYIESFDAHSPFTMDYRLRRHDGVYRWIEDNGRPHFDSEGRFKGYIGSCIDVTERKEAADYFKVIVESSPNAMLLLNEQGTIELVNHEFSKLFGYSPEEIIGQLIEIVVPNEIAHDHVGYRNAYLKNPTPCEIGKERIVRGKRKDGSTFQVEIGLSPFQVGDQRYVVSVIVDVTERKKAQQAIMDSNAILEEKVRERTDALEKANAAKRDFLANMSHEIRNPMNTINISSYMLSREPLTEHQLGMVERIVRSSRSLLNIVNEILDFSKLEAHQLDLDLGSVDVNELIQKVIETQMPMAAQKGIQLHLGKPGLPIPDLLVDAFRIEQVLNNLISNAIKFTDEGDVWLRVDVMKRKRTEVQLHFEVADTGIGIPQEVLPLLGQPFTQADSSVTRKFGGTGLGLSICKKLLELMGGVLQIQSTPGLGSAFSFELTFDVAMAQADEHTDQADATLLLAGLHVLVVDDDQRNLDGMAQLLKAEGAVVTLASSGHIALAFFQRPDIRFDIVLMDIQMPLMDGIEVTRRIRSRISRDALPIIAVTAGILPSQHQQALAAGINQLMRKPVDPAELLKTIRELSG